MKLLQTIALLLVCFFTQYIQTNWLQKTLVAMINNTYKIINLYIYIINYLRKGYVRKYYKD